VTGKNCGLTLSFNPPNVLEQFESMTDQGNSATVRVGFSAELVRRWRSGRLLRELFSCLQMFRHLDDTQVRNGLQFVFRACGRAAAMQMEHFLS
jgi:hypothetical protein